jgi:hypothetical protein
LNVTVCVCPSSLDDTFDTDCLFPIVPTSAADRLTVWGCVAVPRMSSDTLLAAVI